MNLPEAYGREDPDLMTRLTAGLEGVDESLYRQWTMEHAKPKDQGEPSGDPKLSYHAWRQETGLLLEVRNLIAVFINSHLEKGAKPTPMIGYPGSGREPGGDTANHATTLEGLKRLVAGA